MKYCVSCGKKLPDVAVFCPYCGKQQGGLSEEKKEAVAPSPVIKEEKPVETAKPIAEAPKAKPKAAFFIEEESLKVQLIYAAALLGGTLIFWIIGSFVRLIVFIKVLLMFFTAFRVFKGGIPLYKRIRAKGERNWFELFLFGALELLNVVLLILSFVFMAV